jgi:hypothetical protein
VHCFSPFLVSFIVLYNFAFSNTFPLDARTKKRVLFSSPESKSVTRVNLQNTNTKYIPVIITNKNLGFQFKLSSFSFFPFSSGKLIALLVMNTQLRFLRNILFFPITITFCIWL